ncbi:MAG TPA: DUF5723 family protein [Bacteroidia bacterium]|nr:DUF5723 family protein [Bacteroidia bacterium]
MKNRFSHSILPTLLLLFMYFNSSAQQDLTMYHMPAIGQSIRVNPSLMPVNKYYVGLPFISSTYFLYSHNGFVYHDFYKVRSDDSVQIDVTNALSKLDKKNFLKTDFQTDYLSLGITVNKFYITGNITEHVALRFAYAKELLQLINEGNGPFIGRTLDFSKTGFDATHYREYALGLATEINNKWTVGGRVKYLYGLENFSSTTGDLGFITAEEDYHLQVPTDIVINTSGPVNAEDGYDQFSDGTTANASKNLKDYLFHRKNRGLAVDLGGTYKPNETWSFSGSILDLGSIKWKSDVRNYKTSAGQYDFNGVDLKSFLNDTSANIQGALDSLGNVFKAKETKDSYTTNLPTQVNLSANYRIDDNSFAGALVHAEFFKKTIQPAVTLSYNRMVGRHLSLAASYSYINQAFDNIGLGMAVSAGPVQLYVVSDNVLGAIAPLDHNNSHFHFGINLIFGRPLRDRDKDRVPDQTDDCPDIPGLVDLKGCPDRDHDGIPDYLDRCPDTPGLRHFNGCPDADNDGVVDSLDNCPTTPGLIEFLGCPDTDGDSIPDPEDSCSTVKGLRIFNGCPDSDNDGVMDSQDSCVLIPGPASNNGCPIIKKEVIVPKEPVKAQLTVQEQEVINKVFRNLEFETGKAVIRSSSFASLDELTVLLKKKTTFRLLIEGHTDNVGSDALNLKLSQRRAEAVKKYLTDKGIEASRIVSKGYGEMSPVADNKTAEGRQRNRRVEFTILE